MKKLKFLLAPAVLLIIISLNYTTPAVPSNTFTTTGNEQQLTLFAAGDVVMHQPIVKSAAQPDGTFDFRNIFALLKNEIEGADLAVCVLETPLAAPKAPYSGYPRFNSPKEIADALKWSGFDLVFTSHNHILDQGFEGIVSTLNHLEAIGLHSTGSRKSPVYPSYLMINKNGIKLAFFSYTTSTNGIPLPKGREWAVNLFNYQTAEQDIKLARKAGADGIIVALHTGVEYQRSPSLEKIKLIKRLLNLGVDVVLGSHVHVIQPIEPGISKDLTSGEPRTVFVAYSLGNFLSNQRWRYSDCGLTIKLKMVKKPGAPGIRITEAGFNPVWVDVSYNNQSIQYRIIKLEGPEPAIGIADLDQADRERIREVWEDTTKLLQAWASKNLIGER